MRTVWLWFALLCVASGEVLVFRCCPEDEALDSEYRCVGVERDPFWAPVIYSPEDRQLLPPGTTPKTWRFLVSHPQVCNKPHFYPSGTVPPPFFMLTNGSIILESVASLQPGAFCVDPTGALACLSDDDSSTRPSVRKCCGPSALYSEKSESCATAEEDDPIFEGWKMLSGFPVCTETGNYAIGGKLNTTYYLESDGRLIGSYRNLTSSEYCLERLLELPDDSVHVFTCPAKPKPRSHSDIRFTLYPVLLFLSVFFLAVTLIATCLLPSTYHVLHWRCQSNHVACLLIGDFLLAITQLSGEALQGPACILIAIAMHFIFLAAFFWLNTMCFNIWWTFRDLRPASLDKGQENLRLRLYELYAWGCPLFIAGVAALLDHLPRGSFIGPRFGDKRCWFYGNSEMLYYFFGPVGMLLLINLTLFAMTARELTCGLWKTEVVKSNTERAALGRVCLKLVVVMGVTWVADVVSWWVGGPDYIWYFSDIINALQGVLIFAVVGCQPQVWAAVKRLWCLNDGPPRSSSSHALPSIGSDQNTTTTKAVDTLC